MPQARHIRIAHSPDTDDLFMFYALREKKLALAGFTFEFDSADIETLNRRAKDGVYDITALSACAYPFVARHYALLSSGASVAEIDHGPVVVARGPLKTKEFAEKVVAVPGDMTTSRILLKLAFPKLKTRVMHPPEILIAVADGTVGAGLVIHEGQILYESMGLTVVHRLLDTWRGFAGDTPLPLGMNAVRVELGDKVMRALSELQRESILYAMQHRDEARDWCVERNPVLTTGEANRYLDWYANRRTLDLGDDGREGLKLLLERAARAGLVPRVRDVQIV